MTEPEGARPASREERPQNMFADIGGGVLAWVRNLPPAQQGLLYTAGGVGLLLLGLLVIVTRLS